jgi:hypothetical protein
MRRAALISACLIPVFAASAFGCVAGFGGERAPRRSESRKDRMCARKQASSSAMSGSACPDVVKSAPSQCSLRSLTQVQVAKFSRFEVPTPLRVTNARSTVQPNSLLIIASIGSPETDRGPPHS